MTNDRPEPQTLSGQLALLREVSQALAEANGVEEIKNAQKKAEAIRAFAKKMALGLEMQNLAAEVKLRAERKAGARLAELALRGGDRKSNRHDAILKLADLRIDRSESARWQREAAVPEAVFEEYLAGVTAAKEEISSAGFRRYAKKLGLFERRHGGRIAHRNTMAKDRRAGRRSRPTIDALSWTLQRDAFRIEAAREAKDHYRRLAAILGPLFSHGTITLTSAERRYLPHLVTELGRLIDDATR